MKGRIAQSVDGNIRRARGDWFSLRALGSGGDRDPLLGERTIDDS
jgi:hypothetical protein